MNRSDIIQNFVPVQPSSWSEAVTTDPYVDFRLTTVTAPSLSVVCPCYNEQESLGELYRRITQACKEHVGDSYEIVLVDDGSIDATRSIIAGILRSRSACAGRAVISKPRPSTSTVSRAARLPR